MKTCNNERFSEPNYNDLTPRLGVVAWDIFIVRSLAATHGRSEIFAADGCRPLTTPPKFPLREFKPTPDPEHESLSRRTPGNEHPELDFFANHPEWHAWKSAAPGTIINMHGGGRWTNINNFILIRLRDSSSNSPRPWAWVIRVVFVRVYQPWLPRRLNYFFLRRR
jgi:hypothetical protein